MGSGGASLSGDTVLYASVGREMVERGDWTRLTVDGEPYRNKPPLLFWAEAGAMSVLGFTETAARLPSRVFGLATVALLMLLVSRAHGRRAAFWAGTALVTWLVFQRSASLPRLDAALAFWSLAAMGLFLAIDRRGLTFVRAAGTGACLGFAVLTKGPAGLLALCAIATGAIVTGRGRLLLRTAAVAVPALLVVALPWYALQLAREGWTFALVLAEDMGRDGSPTSDLGSALRLYATDVFLLGLPWLVPLFLGLKTAARRVRERPGRSLAEAILVAFVVVHVAGVAGRGVHYSRYFVVVLPVYAWLAGVATAAGLRRARKPGWRRLHAGVAAGLAFAVLVAYPITLATGLLQTRDKYATLRRAVESLHDEAPRATALPTWSAKQDATHAAGEDGLKRGIGAVRAASRFYFGVSLVPWIPEDPARQPPLVYLRHPEGAEPFRSAFKAKHGLVPVFEADEGSLYRTR